MVNASLEKLKYPIGKPQIPENITQENIDNWIAVLEKFPERLGSLVANLSEEQLLYSF